MNRSRSFLAGLLLALGAHPAAAMPLPAPAGSAPALAISRAADPVARFTGTARNGSYTGRVVLDLSQPDASTGALRGEIHFSNGLYGDGPLQGVLQGGTLRMQGYVQYAGTSIPFVLVGQMSAQWDLTATYSLQPTNAAQQRGEFTASLDRGGAGAAPTGSSPSAPPAQRRQPSSSGDIEWFQAEEVKPVQPAQDVQRFDADPAKPRTPGDDQFWNRPDASAAPAALDGLFRTWNIHVEGAVYTTDNYAAGTRTTTISPGAASKDRLTISPQGTYVWGSRRGKWRRTGNESYPIELIAADGGKNWGVGWDTRPQGRRGEILLVDGSIWLVGSPSR